MKLRDAGLSLDDLSEIISVLYVECQNLEDENGAPPPQTIGTPVPNTPNPDYARYLRLHKIVQSCSIFNDMVTTYDTENQLANPTNPAVVMTVQVGGW